MHFIASRGLYFMEGTDCGLVFDHAVEYVTAGIFLKSVEQHSTQNVFDMV